MREMKVRVWDDVLKEMLYSHVEQFDDMLGFRFEKHLETENPIYMWSTGRHDRNGREIYEGDIIETEKMEYSDSGHYIGMVKVLGKVVFNNGMYALRLETGAMPDLNFGSSFHKVIGNIYEHPHLLKGEENA